MFVPVWLCILLIVSASFSIWSLIFLTIGFKGYMSNNKSNDKSNDNRTL